MGWVHWQINKNIEGNWILQRDLFLKEILPTAELLSSNSNKNNLITFIVEHWINSLHLIVESIYDILRLYLQIDIQKMDKHWEANQWSHKRWY